jgi:hypothetical protein
MQREDGRGQDDCPEDHGYGKSGRYGELRVGQHALRWDRCPQEASARGRCRSAAESDGDARMRVSDGA